MTPNRKYEQGVRFERWLVKWYENFPEQPLVARTAGSHGKYDVIVVFPRSLTLLQAKTVTASSLPNFDLNEMLDEVTEGRIYKLAVAVKVKNRYNRLCFWRTSAGKLWNSWDQLAPEVEAWANKIIAS